MIDIDYNDLYFNKIYDNGTCPHLEECNRKNYEYGHTCYRAKIGKEYENAEIRIMFVGKEAPNDSKSVTSPAKVREVRSDNRHYFGLYYTALLILSDIVPNNTKQSTLVEHEGLEEQDCLTNYYKCAFKKKDEKDKIHGIATNSKMKKYCPILLTKEIDLLRPDIVVIQGKFTGKAFWDEKKGKLYEIVTTGQQIFPDSDKEEDITLYKYQYRDTNKPMYILWGFHPASSDFYKRGNTNNLEVLKKAIQVFKGDII